MALMSSRLRSLLASPLVPAGVIVAGLVFLGCTNGYSPGPYHLSQSPAMLEVRYANIIGPAQVPADPSTLHVVPLGIRPSEKGFWADFLLLGEPGPRVAVHLNEKARDEASLNAVIGLRRIAPEPAPVRVRWDPPAVMQVSRDALGRDYAHGYYDKSMRVLPKGKLILSVPLRSEPFLIDGRYELRLLVPQGDAFRIADLRDVNVSLDQSTVINDVRRLPW